MKLKTQETKSDVPAEPQGILPPPVPFDPWEQKFRSKYQTVRYRFGAEPRKMSSFDEE